MTTTTKTKGREEKIILFIFSGIIGLPAYYWLYNFNWKLALVISMIMWSDNIVKKIYEKDYEN